MGISMALLLADIVLPAVFAQPWGLIPTGSSTQDLALNRAGICPVDDSPISLTDDRPPPLDDLWQAWDKKYIQDPWDLRDGWSGEAPSAADGAQSPPKVVLLFC